MNTKMIVCLVAATLLSASFVEAQQPTKVPRIGFLNALFPTTNPARIEAFRQGLRDVGYVEGKNIIIEFRYAERKVDRLPTLAAELVRLKVDVIVTSVSQETCVAKEETGTTVRREVYRRRKQVGCTLARRTSLS